MDEVVHQQVLSALSEKYNTKKKESESMEKTELDSIEKKSDSDPVVTTNDKTVSVEINPPDVDKKEPANTDENKNIEPLDSEKKIDVIPSMVTEIRFESVGPVLGQEMRTKTLYAVVLAILMIIAYIAWVFRKASRPVASWKYGVTAVVALMHDILITIGCFALLGKFFNIEVNLTFVAALLTILGYSVNDTIVVFDRIRENIFRASSDDMFVDIVNKAINQTVIRSINTSMTVLLALIAIFFFGGNSIQDFTLALIIGVFFGTYSSIFIASALIVSWNFYSKKKLKRAE